MTLCTQPLLMILVMPLLNLQRQVGVHGSLLGDYRELDFAIGGYSPSSPHYHYSLHLEPPMSENDLKLAGTSSETKDDYDFNVVNANEAMLLILQLASAFCAQVGGPKAAPFRPLDFLQVGGPFREVGGPRPTLDVW